MNNMENPSLPGEQQSGATAKIGNENEVHQLPETLPLLPLRGVVLYPTIYLPLTIGQARSLRLIEDLTNQKQRLLALAASRDPSLEEPTEQDIHRIGVVARIQRLVRSPDGTMRLIIHGLERIVIDEFIASEPYLQVKASPNPDKVVGDVSEEALARASQDLFAQLIAVVPQLPDELESAARNARDYRQLVYLIASSVPLPLEEKQALLELDPLSEKLKRLNFLLTSEVEAREIAQHIQQEAQGEMQKAQRDYLLRKQMEAIQRELGQEDGQSAEIADYERRIAEAAMSEEATKEAQRELDRMRRMPIQAAEYSVIKTYLDWLLSLPWQSATSDNLDVRHARLVLDEDHYGLDEVKDRIIEFLAVRKLREDRREERDAAAQPGDQIRKEREGVILCFVGPPGVGKTSLGLSIAHAMGRKFIRLALGGIRDEAEIRGFRRTYIGSMPGRVIQSLRRVESRNPVFMLDEVDKLGRDFRGDPSSALLEVLDPEQNSEFRDHYLDVTFDLSQTFFITTANWLDPIPGPLRDRMEIIHIPSYTDEEKIQIAQRHLIPRQIRENGLRPDEISFSADALYHIVREYTREAGVRGLERQIGAACRKVATRIAAGELAADNGQVTVTPDGLADLLGKARFFDETHDWVTVPGVAVGLAWTPVGGQVLHIEATAMPGKGRLQLTGQLGEVMKESAMAALSYVRSVATEHAVPIGWFEEHDLHIHVPAGAQPKDGPSAGVAIATAILSLVTGRCAREGVAMTGEITLRGRVTRIGGVREKVLAAHRLGMTTVILPEHNRVDLEDVPDKVREQMNFIFTKRVEDVWSAALSPEIGPLPPPGLPAQMQDQSEDQSTVA
ncbi:MAG: endopeptidase La [Caldilineales bacterium]|nr:endopeptidase La [Caldilineales bacterium]